MGSKGVLIKELFDAIFTRQSDTLHILMDIHADFIIIITEHKSITIIAVLLLHLLLRFWYMIIITVFIRLQADLGYKPRPQILNV